MKDWIYNNAVVARLVVIWACALTTFVVVVTWLCPPNIPVGTATAFATFFSLPALGIGLYKWRMDKNAEASNTTEE